MCLHGFSQSGHEQVAWRSFRELRALVAAGYALPPDLTVAEAQRYVDARRARPNVRTGKPVSVESVKITIRAMKAYSAWVAEKYQEPDLLDGLHHPHSPRPVGGKIVSRAEYEKLMRSFGSTIGMAAVRDQAMIAMLWVSGMRRSDLVRLEVGDLMERNTVAVIRRSKNGQGRLVSLRTKKDDSAVYLDRYIRLRSKHPDADLPNLWLGQRGPLTGDGFSLVLRARCKRAGLSIASHEFRRSLASRWLEAGLSQVLLMENCGWSSSETLRRYVAQDASRLAIEAARSLSSPTTPRGS
jgi:integrase